MIPVHLVTYIGTVDGTDESMQARQRLLAASAMAYGGVVSVDMWDRDRLVETQFYRDNQTLLDTPRGCGYWSWKPFIILQAMAKVAADDYVYYHDVGNPLIAENIGNVIYESVQPLANWAQQRQGRLPGVYIPFHGANRKWTKRDCFVAMDCDNEEYWQSPQVQAGYTLWKNNTANREILQRWLEYCCDTTIVGDDDNVLGQPNFADFRDHRHDQSVFTNLCLKEKLTPMGGKEVPFWGYRNTNFLSLEAFFQTQMSKGLATLRKTAQKYQLLNQDRHLIRWIELLFAKRKGDSLDILLMGEVNTDKQLWQDYFKQATFFNAKDRATGAYDLILGYHLSLEQQDISTVEVLNTQLKPKGVLVVGPLLKEGDAAKQRWHQQTRDYEKRVNSKQLAEADKPYFLPHMKNPIFVWGKTRGHMLLCRAPDYQQIVQDLANYTLKELDG